MFEKYLHSCLTRAADVAHLLRAPNAYVRLLRERTVSFHFSKHFFALRLSICFAAAALVLINPISASAQSDGAFHELETKYLFGSFTIGSSTGIEGEKAIEPDTQANFGKRGGRYGVTETELEFEYTPNQYVELELGPTISL